MNRKMNTLSLKFLMTSLMGTLGDGMVSSIIVKLFSLERDGVPGVSAIVIEMTEPADALDPLNPERLKKK